jgi:hypothetical protein
MGSWVACTITLGVKLIVIWSMSHLVLAFGELQQLMMEMSLSWSLARGYWIHRMEIVQGKMLIAPLFREMSQEWKVSITTDTRGWGKVHISAKAIVDYINSFGILHKKIKIACLEISVRVSDSCINLNWQGWHVFINSRSDLMDSLMIIGIVLVTIDCCYLFFSIAVT